MQLITLSGVDGSGKSTQTKLLSEYFAQNGQKVVYFHAIEHSLLNRIARIIKGKKEFKPGSEKAVTKANPLTLLLREIFLAIDMLRFGSVRRKAEKEGVSYILSDRFFFDTLVNIAYLRDAENADSFAKDFLPKVDHAFYFRIAPEAIMTRSRVPEQGLEYLKKKAALFERELTDWNMIAIDANQSKETIFEEIKSKL